MDNNYSNYTEAYRLLLERTCEKLGIDPHAMRVFDKKLFEEATAGCITEKIIKFCESGEKFAAKYPDEATRFLEANPMDPPRLYMAKNERNKKQFGDRSDAVPADIIKDLYNSFNIGMECTLSGRSFSSHVYLSNLMKDSEVLFK